MWKLSARVASAEAALETTQNVLVSCERNLSSSFSYDECSASADAAVQAAVASAQADAAAEARAVVTEIATAKAEAEASLADAERRLKLCKANKRPVAAKKPPSPPTMSRAALSVICLGRPFVLLLVRYFYRLRARRAAGACRWPPAAPRTGRGAHARGQRARGCGRGGGGGEGDGGGDGGGGARDEAERAASDALAIEASANEARQSLLEEAEAAQPRGGGGGGGGGLC